MKTDGNGWERMKAGDDLRKLTVLTLSCNTVDYISSVEICFHPFCLAGAGLLACLTRLGRALSVLRHARNEERHFCHRRTPPEGAEE